MAGPSVLTLTATAGNAFGGPITASGGTLQGTAASLATPIYLANNANVTYVQNASGTLSLPVRGAGSLLKTGSGMLTLGAPCAYQGTTTIGAGTLQLPASSANAGLVVRYSMDGPLGAIADGTTITDLGFSSNGNNGTMVGSWGSYVPGQFGQGIQFNGSQSIQTPYSPSIDVHAWTNSVWINVPANTSGYAISNELLSGRNAAFSNGWTGGFDEFYNTDASGNGSFYTEIPAVGSGWITTVSNNFTLTPSAWHMVTTTVSSGAEQIYVDGALQVTNALAGGYSPCLMTSGSDFLSIGAGVTSLTMDEFQLYNTVLSAAQIQKVYQNQALGFGSALPSSTPVTLAGGATLDLNGAAQTVGSLADGAGGGGTVTNSSTSTATLTLAPTGSTTFSGHIQDGAGHVAIIINGSGIQVLAGSNTYTGGTQVTGGILVVANANGSATGTGAVTLSGGTLASGAGGSISGSVTIGSVASEIAPGGIGAIGHLTIGSLVTASNLTTLDFDLTTPGGSGDLLTITNALDAGIVHGHYVRGRPDDRRRLPLDRRQFRHADARPLPASHGPLGPDLRVVHERGPGLYRPGGVGDVAQHRVRRGPCRARALDLGPAGCRRGGTVGLRVATAADGVTSLTCDAVEGGTMNGRQRFWFGVAVLALGLGLLAAAPAAEADGSLLGLDQQHRHLVDFGDGLVHLHRPSRVAGLDEYAPLTTLTSTAATVAGKRSPSATRWWPATSPSPAPRTPSPAARWTWPAAAAPAPSPPTTTPPSVQSLPARLP